MKWICLFFICSTLGSSTPFVEPFFKRPPTEAQSITLVSVAVPRKYYNMITIACDFYDVPQYYFSKMLEVESNFNPKAVAGPNQNGSYDYGIAQLNSEYLEEFGWRYNFGKIDPFDPEQSILVAAKHLSVLYMCTGDWRLAFASYNAGLSRVLSNRIPPSTQQYVRKIFGEEDA